MRIRMLILCGLYTLAPFVHADVYRCDSPEGAVFQDRPCGSGATLVVLPRPAAAATGVRESERRWLKERRQRKSRPVRQVRVRTRDDEARKRRCWNKRTRLETVKGRLRHGYKPSQGDRLRRQRRNYEDYLSRFCG